MAGHSFPIALLTTLCFSCLFLPVASYTPLGAATLKALPDPAGDFDIKNGQLLSPILRPRVSGTEGNYAVQNHFINFFRTNLPKWNVEMQNSTSTTPTSNGEEIPFVNIIASRDPPWTTPGNVGRLTLVAHYDSKLTPNGFIGATDSAAPCAMLMYLAQQLDGPLTKKWKSMLEEGKYAGLDEEEKGIQILFLDGEEAFKSWTHTDSLYGARSLAEEWENEFHTANSINHNRLASISLFLLLDLLGAKGPRVPSYFKTTHWAYKSMAKIEDRMRSLGLFKSSPNHPANRERRQKKSKKPIQWRKEPLFLKDGDKDNDRFSSMIEDDHLPFMARGVDILHIIPSPFPTVWHDMADDGEHLDMDTVEDWAKLVTAFAAEWMDLEGSLRQIGKTAEKRADREYGDSHSELNSD